MASEDAYIEAGHFPLRTLRSVCVRGHCKKSISHKYGPFVPAVGLGNFGLIKRSANELAVNARHNVHVADLGWQDKSQLAIFGLLVLLHGGQDLLSVQLG